MGPERADLGSERADLGPERGLGGGRTDGRTDGHTKFPLLHRTSVPSGPLRGRCPKKEERKKGKRKRKV